eukprot:2331481-Amphidinium_carterae.1
MLETFRRQRDAPPDDYDGLHLCSYRGCENELILMCTLSTLQLALALVVSDLFERCGSSICPGELFKRRVVAMSHQTRTAEHVDRSWVS